MEALPDDFHDRVRQRFLDLARREPHRYLVLDGSDPREHLQEAIRRRVRDLAPISPARRADLESKLGEEELARQRRATAEADVRRLDAELRGRSRDEARARQEARRRAREEVERQLWAEETERLDREEDERQTVLPPVDTSTTPADPAASRPSRRPSRPSQPSRPSTERSGAVAQPDAIELPQPEGDDGAQDATGRREAGTGGRGLPGWLRRSRRGAGRAASADLENEIFGRRKGH
jgi:dTMP kinase